MTTDIIDNSAETLEAVKGFILKNAPSSLTDWSRKDIENDKVGRLSIKFYNHEIKTDVSLYVSVIDYGEDQFEDSEGNLWQNNSVSCKINWSAYGETATDLALARLSLMTEVANFAKSIEKAFPDVVYRLIQTKSAREEYAKKAAHIDASREVKKFCENETKGMRIGSTRFINLPGDTPPLAGTYTFEMNKKNYKAIVHTSNQITLFRIS